MGKRRAIPGASGARSARSVGAAGCHACHLLAVESTAHRGSHRGSPCTLAGAFLGSCYGSCESFKGRRFNVVSSCKTCQAAQNIQSSRCFGTFCDTFCRSFKTNQVDQGGNSKIYQDHFSRKQLFGGRMGCFFPCRLPAASKRFIKLLALRRIRRSGILQPAWLCEWEIDFFDFTTINNYKL